MSNSVIPEKANLARIVLLTDKQWLARDLEYLIRSIEGIYDYRRFVFGSAATRGRENT